MFKNVSIIDNIILLVGKTATIGLIIGRSTFGNARNFVQ
jgi:hypothetical protein